MVLLGLSRFGNSNVADGRKGDCRLMTVCFFTRMDRVLHLTPIIYLPALPLLDLTTSRTRTRTRSRTIQMTRSMTRTRTGRRTRTRTRYIDPKPRLGLL